MDIEDIALKYGESYHLKKDHNPYYEMDSDRRVRDNRLEDFNKIIRPHLGKKHDDDKLMELMKFIYDSNPISQDEYNVARTNGMRKIKINPRKTELYYIYQIMVRDGLIEDNHVRNFLQAASQRSNSGVMVFAILTHPFWKEKDGKEKSFSCKYDCAYCPQQPNRPRSYVDGEPAQDRALTVEYSTKKQVYVRATTYKINGHAVDKAEVIILGGTWHSYPLEYREQFMIEMYYAFNTIYENRGRDKMSLKEEMEYNKNKSKCKVIGVTIETRPDQIRPDELKILRNMGVTRVQLGIQHINDRILKRIKRRCNDKTSRYSIKLLKDNGFKVDIHLMPDLPKPFTKEFEEKHNLNKITHDDYGKDDIDWIFDVYSEDDNMFYTVFFDEFYCPDQIKIYPFEVMDWTSLKKDYELGYHKSYAEIQDGKVEGNKLVELLIKYMVKIPQYIRVNRLIRDIPESYIFGGIKCMDGRSKIEQIMKKRCLRSNDIRGREIKKLNIDDLEIRVKVLEYNASRGKEYFIQYVTVCNDPIKKFTLDDRLIGFLRLRLSDDSGYDKKTKKYVFDDLKDCAMIRELHVYGQTTSVRDKSSTVSSQHRGFGTKLLTKAFELSKEKGYKKISVIAGEGVKNYYEKFGFVDSEYFMFKTL